LFDHCILELANRAIARHCPGAENCLFVDSEAGGKAAVIACTPIETAKLNTVDPQAWLADTLARISDHKITRVDNLLPWHCNG
jgi:transposase